LKETRGGGCNKEERENAKRSSKNTHTHTFTHTCKHRLGYFEKNNNNESVMNDNSVSTAERVYVFAPFFFSFPQRKN
jgi:hypothetical protein